MPALFISRGFMSLPVSIQKIISISTVGVALSLEVAIAPTSAIPINNSWEIAQAFRPPNRGAPAATEGAGTRGGACIAASERDKFKAIVPQSNLGLTTSTRPVFFGSIPRSTAKGVEFILRSQNNQLLYRTKFALPAQPGIVSFNLPDNAPSLRTGTMYRWSFILICDESDRSGDAITPSAWIEAIKPDPTLAARIRNARPEALPAIYADAGIWHDALASRLKLRRSQPVADWNRNWEQLLTTAGLQAFVQAPIVECCQVSRR
jgi:Domain of Unknown Function (DUF928)